MFLLKIFKYSWSSWVVHPLAGRHVAPHLPSPPLTEGSTRPLGYRQTGSACVPSSVPLPGSHVLMGGPQQN